jgi:hypothetical protein
MMGARLKEISAYGHCQTCYGRLVNHLNNTFGPNGFSIGSTIVMMAVMYLYI